jgi:hypothetical protein
MAANTSLPSLGHLQNEESFVIGVSVELQAILYHLDYPYAKAGTKQRAIRNSKDLPLLIKSV